MAAIRASNLSCCLRACVPGGCPVTRTGTNARDAGTRWDGTGAGQGIPETGVRCALYAMTRPHGGYAGHLRIHRSAMTRHRTAPCAAVAWLELDGITARVSPRLLGAARLGAHGWSAAMQEHPLGAGGPPLDTPPTSGCRQPATPCAPREGRACRQSQVTRQCGGIARQQRRAARQHEVACEPRPAQKDSPCWAAGALSRAATHEGSARQRERGWHVGLAGGQAEAAAPQGTPRGSRA